MHTAILSRRRALVALFCAVAGCAQPKATTLPDSVTAWNQELRRTGAPGSALELHADWRNMAARKGAGAAYGEGTRAVAVEVWEFKTPANAFEAIQRWRAQAGMTAFQKDSSVVVCASQAMSQDELLEFARALQKGMASQ